MQVGASKPSALTEPRGEEDFMDIWDVRYQSHVWGKPSPFGNSCYIDAPLDIWAGLQHWAGASSSASLLVLPPTLERNAFIVHNNLPIDLMDDTETPPTAQPGTQLLLKPDRATPLQNWWAARYELYTSVSVPAPERMDALVEQLNQARTAFRLACEQSRVVGSSEAEIAATLNVICCTRTRSQYASFAMPELAMR